MFSVRSPPAVLFTLVSLLLACGPLPDEPEQGSLVAIFRAEDGTLSEGVRGEFFVGQTHPGRALTARITLKNVGTTAVPLAPIEAQGGARTWVPGGVEPGVPVFEVSAPAVASLEPGAHTELVITFDAPREGRFVASIRVSTVSVTLIGVADPAPITEGPELRLVPEGAQDFGYVPWFPTAPVTMKRQVWIANFGATSRRIHRAVVQAMNAESADTELEVFIGDEGLTLPPEPPDHAQPAELRLTAATPGAKAWRVTLFTTSPDTPELVFEVRAQAVAPTGCALQITPTQLDFGLVSPPDSRERFVEITHEGSAPSELCVIWDFALAPGSSPAFGLSDVAIPPTLVPRGSSIRVPVRFFADVQPPSSSVSKHEGTLTFRTPSSIEEVPLSALHAPGDCLAIFPDELDFGTVMAGCSSATRTFSIFNSCPEEIVVTSFRMQAAAGQLAGGPDCPGTSDCPEFLLTSSPAIPAGGLVLAPGTAPQTFQARYRPIDLGADTGALAIDARIGASTRTFVVTFSGQGGPGAQQTDVFVQDPPPKVDTLFVIDDSASMANDQASIASNLDAFLQLWLSRYLDFQLGVVTATPTGNATLLTGPGHPDAVLTRSSPNLQAQFAARVNVGTSGTGGPRCLERALQALTSNPGFVRSGAALEVVCITDSADVSPLLVADYLDDLWAIKGPNMKSWFSFNAIGGFSATCPGDNGRLADAVTQTYGAKGNICEPTWDNALLSYGELAWGFRTSFFLTSNPNLSAGPLTVTLDGQPLAPTDPLGATVWRFDTVANAIVFDDPSLAPQGGQMLEVTYTTTCVP